MEPMLDCRAVMQQLWDYLDDEITTDRAAAIDAHLAKCSHCHPLFEFERGYQRAVAATGPQHPDLAGLAVRLRWALKEAGFEPPAEVR